MVAPNLFGELDKIIKSVVPATIEYGERVAELVRVRTRSGKNMMGGAFTPYSQRWADKKKGGARTPVTLTDTGSMLDGLVVVNKQATLDSSGRIAVEVTNNDKDDSWKMKSHQYGLRNPQRQFLGVTDEEQKDLLRVFDDTMYKPVSTKDEIVYKL